MGTFFLTLGITFLFLGIAIYLMASYHAFEVEIEELDNMITYSVQTDKNYKKIRNKLEFISRMPIKSRAKMDEMTKLFIKKFKFQIYVDMNELPEMKLYSRIVRLTA